MSVIVHMGIFTFAYDYLQTMSEPVGPTTRTSPSEVGPTGTAGSITALTNGGVATTTINTSLATTTQTNGETSGNTRRATRLRTIGKTSGKTSRTTKFEKTTNR